MGTSCLFFTKLKKNKGNFFIRYLLFIYPKIDCHIIYLMEIFKRYKIKNTRNTINSKIVDKDYSGFLGNYKMKTCSRSLTFKDEINLEIDESILSSFSLFSPTSNFVAVQYCASVGRLRKRKVWRSVNNCYLSVLVPYGYWESGEFWNTHLVDYADCCL